MPPSLPPHTSLHLPTRFYLHRFYGSCKIQALAYPCSNSKVLAIEGVEAPVGSYYGSLTCVLKQAGGDNSLFDGSSSIQLRGAAAARFQYEEQRRNSGSFMFSGECSYSVSAEDSAVATAALPLLPASEHSNGATPNWTGGMTNGTSRAEEQTEDRGEPENS
ncbi:hypothetical protein DM860_001149 [Cuscuta australis]|uniref:Uncharacterized protein n=1 Tax=Cuscuta australis TaxID=267555 RepID=A0A328DWS7_9ASTE|nr:hypothetical protein DM860_001149 [Cuscuta australis]